MDRMPPIRDAAAEIRRGPDLRGPAHAYDVASAGRAIMNTTTTTGQIERRDFLKKTGASPA